MRAMEKLYLSPISFVDAPQAVGGDAVRLAGSMVYAREFALIRRGADGAIMARDIVAAPDMASAIARLPDDLGAEAERQWANLRMAHPALTLATPGGARTIRLDQPQVMGILNITPDSFSDGGRLAAGTDAAVDHGAAMLEAGAAIIDVGGESTRPNADPVHEGEELRRAIPVIERLARGGAAVSVDTRNGTVMAEAIAAGAGIINDVSALRHDPRAMDIVAQAHVPVVAMHAPGKGGDLHGDAAYGDVVLDVFDWLAARRDAMIAAGIARERIVLDPGIGFGKTLSENLALINALPLFHALGQPLLLGASRKRFIGALAKEVPAPERMPGSLAVALKGMDAGMALLRVHDAAETVQAMRVWRGLRDAALTDFARLAE